MPDSREHTASYYAATRTPDTEYPQLTGELHCDVAVVGAGFTGVSAALHLVERGYAVALIEANRIGWGASGRNGGQLIGGFVNVDKIGKRFGVAAADMARQMGIESRDILVQRVRKYSIDCDLKFGFLDVALRDRDMRDFEDYLADKQQANYAYEMRIVSQSEMPGYLGTDYYIGGLADYGNGHLHPLNLCIGEARAAHELGAKVFEQTRVTRIQHGKNPVVITESGRVRASKVVLAGNAYLGNTEPRIRNRIIPAGSYIIATEPLSDSLARELLPADMAYCEQTVGLNYFRLSPDKRMLFGGMCNYSGRDPKSITASLRPKMLKIFPQLKDTRIDYEWGGRIAISVNRIPQFGRIEGNTYYAQGYSGHGVAPTHLAGKMLADAVAGDSEQFDMFSKVRHWWLPGGKWFANPALALGMMYYRLKERL
jgi:gamma-glutamylputrescine oxidase